MSPARELNATALDPARSVVVEACAGSGKTWLLVSRIIRLLLDGAEPGDILAITFTRKAAQEMATRLRAWLYELATADDDVARRMLSERELAADAVETLLPRARGLYEKLLTAEPGITLTTFHSWFLQLLARAPLDAGAGGGTTLVEQTAALIDEAWDRYALALQRDPAQPGAAALDRLFGDLGLVATRELMRGFIQRRADWWAATAHCAPEDALADQLARLRTEFGLADDEDPRVRALSDPALRADLVAYAALLGRNTAREQAHAAQIVAVLDADPLALFAAAESAVFTGEGVPRAKKESAAQRKRLGADGEARLLGLHEALAARLAAVREACRDLEAWRFNAAALTCGVGLLETYQQVKRDAQALDYGDIEWRTYRLLARSEHAAYLQYKLDARYAHVLLDEFQDTNPLQWLTLKAWFAAAADAGSRPSVFLVGDPKQSIYRFRRAEARLFAHAQAYLENAFGAAVLRQNETRRCAQAVIDVVNAVFRAAPEYEGYAAHAVHASAKPGRVEVWPLATRDAPAGGAQAPADLRNPLLSPLPVVEDLRRDEEARQLVAGVQACVGRVAVASDAAGERLRPARYADVLVLVRSRTHLAAYERALRHAGIPYVTSRQGGLLDTLEACDVTALLEFLIAPFADLKLAHALRSPVFGCTDADLMQLAAAGPGPWWDRLRGLAEPSPALARARRLLADWLARADALPVHDQLDRIYFEGDVLARYGAAVPAAQRQAVRANLEAYVQRALASGAGRYPSLPRFLAELEELRAAPAEEAPNEGETHGDGDALRILTVHGAKGLEAPIVWLLDAAAARRTGGGEALIDWPPGDDQPRHFSLWTRRDALSRAQAVHHAGEELIAAREDLNLLYVAMTRAQQMLVVSGAAGQRRDDGWYGRIRSATLAAGGVEEADGRVVYGRLPAADMPQREAGVTAGAGAPDPRLTAVLEVGTRAANAATDGTRYGVAFHAVMDRLTHSGGGNDGGNDRAEGGNDRADGGDETLRARLGLDAPTFEAVLGQARALLARPELRRYFDPACYRHAANEVPYADASGAVRRIDRLVEFDADVWVLDYKTGGHELTPALAAAYDEQLAAYCAAARALFPGKTVRGLLVFTDGVSRLVAGDAHR